MSVRLKTHACCLIFTRKSDRNLTSLLQSQLMKYALSCGCTGSQIAQRCWTNHGPMLYTTLVHGWHTMLGQRSFDRRANDGPTLANQHWPYVYAKLVQW